QIPLALHYLHGLQRTEVASVLKVPAGTVDSRIARGLERLRTLLEGKRATAGALMSIGMLEAGLKSLPLAKAPSGIGALETICKLDAVRTTSRPARHISRLAPRTVGLGGFVAAVAAIAAGGIWWVTHSTSSAPESNNRSNARTAPVVTPAEDVPLSLR